MGNPSLRLSVCSSYLAFVDIERDPIHRSLGAVADTQVFDLESKTSHRRRFRCQSAYTQGIQLTGAGGCGEGRRIIVSRIRTATTSPEIAVSAATVTIAAEKPAASAMVPATIAPTAYPESRQRR